MKKIVAVLAILGVLAGVRLVGSEMCIRDRGWGYGGGYGAAVGAMAGAALLGGVIGGLAGGGYGYGYGGYYPYGGYYNCVPRPIYNAWGQTVGYAAC